MTLTEMIAVESSWKKTQMQNMVDLFCEFANI